MRNRFENYGKYEFNRIMIIFRFDQKKGATAKSTPNKALLACCLRSRVGPHRCPLSLAPANIVLFLQIAMVLIIFYSVISKF